MDKKKQKQQLQNLACFEIGKLPPQSVELEEVVLGAIMLERDALIEIIDILKPESFYKDEHQKIFSAIMDLFSKEKSIDLLTVTEQLRVRKELDLVGGPARLSELTYRVSSAAHIEYHARIVQQKFIAREMIRISSTIQSMAFDESIDIDDVLEYSESEVFRISQGIVKKDPENINTLLKKTIDEIDKASKNNESLVGIPSGFIALDRKTNGWQNENLIIIAARPSMGKTAFMVSMARNIALDFKKKIAIFSLEMSSTQLTRRLISAHTFISSQLLVSGKLNEPEWNTITNKCPAFIDSNIFIDDTPALTIFELRAKSRRLKQQHGIDIIMIDYLQLMGSSSEFKGNREQEVSNISRSLKAISKELSVPVICLSQLNRSVETRGGDKRPQLSDLRESGAIEQDADIVAFIHRPEYYGISEYEGGESTKNMVEILIRKHRDGALGDVMLTHDDYFCRISDISDNNFMPITNEF